MTPSSQAIAPAGARRRGDVHPPRRRDEWTRDEAIARAHAASVVAERELQLSIREAESNYREIERIGLEFDRGLEHVKQHLRAAGYLRQ